MTLLTVALFLTILSPVVNSLSCLVVRPGYGLVSEKCPPTAVGCRIKVGKDHIDWYEWAKLYDRNQLVCVYPEEYSHLSGCQRKASGSVRCWCGGKDDCNDAVTSKAIYESFIGKSDQKMEDIIKSLQQTEETTTTSTTTRKPRVTTRRRTTSTTTTTTTPKPTTTRRRIVVNKVTIKNRITTPPTPRTTTPPNTPRSTHAPTTEKVANLPVPDSIEYDEEDNIEEKAHELPTPTDLGLDKLFDETRKKLEKERMEENKQLEQLLMDEEKELEDDEEDDDGDDRTEDEKMQYSRKMSSTERRERARAEERRMEAEEEKLAEMEREEAEEKDRKARDEKKNRLPEEVDEKYEDYDGFGYSADSFNSFNLLPSLLLLLWRFF